MIFRKRDSNKSRHLDTMQDEQRGGVSDTPIKGPGAKKRCGARTRSGKPCRRADLFPSGRCRLHGGLSTGAKTEAGKAQALINLGKRWPKPAAAALIVDDSFSKDLA